MGRISDILPASYHDKNNNLIKFTNALDFEIKELEYKTKSLTDLINIDNCEEKYLPYLASITGCPLFGIESHLWRRQIKNWPYILKFKGTAKSLEIFLNSINVDEHRLYTFFRDEQNNLIENKPDGQPFKDDLGVWHNIRTHYFDLDLIYNNKHYLTWSQWHDELIRSMNIWLVKAKPFHSELRNLSIILKRNTDFKFEIGTGTFQGTQHAIDFIQHTSSNTKFNMSIGTGTFHTWTHEIKHVQATEAENISAVYAGANVIQGVNHEVDFQQHTSGSSNINVIIGTGTFQNIRHDVQIQQATEAEDNSDIYAGANVIQGANHEVDIQQHTSGNSGINVVIGTGTLQNIRHNVKMQQATDGKGDAVINAGAGIFQGSHHEVNINQSEQNNTHNQILTGCTLSCGIHIQIKMAA